MPPALSMTVRRIPRDGSLDSTLALGRDPYRFIAKRCRHHKTDIFQTRLLFKPAICMTGPEASELFYNPEHFQRYGAQPGRIQKTLFGKGGVQQLDGAPHRHRKLMFMSLVAPERISELTRIASELLYQYAHKWKSQPKIILYREIRQLLTEAVCAWTGVPLAPADIPRRTEELVAQFHSGGAFGPAYWRARIIRKRADQWIQSVIREIRNGKLQPPASSAARLIASYRDLNGQCLSPDVAAVELINVLRPTVAVAVFIVFVAHALHQYSEYRDELRNGNGDTAEMFAQEVRRFYPFFPALVAQTRHDFEWQGFHIPRGTRALLDIYGTNHDPRVWREPDEFWPERFQIRAVNPFNFIPQGGGTANLGHRCPGETITVELMKTAADFLLNRISYDVPKQNLEIDFGRLPAMVPSCFVISNVRVL